MTDEHLCVSLVPLFNHLDLENQRLINQVAVHKTFEKGEQIMVPGGAESLAIVARGAMKVYQLSINGKEQLLRVVEPGGYEGENTIFGAINENLFVEALQKSEICIINKQDFQKLLVSFPQLSLKLLSLTASKITSLEQQSQFLMMERIEERLATYLIDLYKVTNNKQLTLPMKKKELAAFLGTTPETLSRKLKFLSDEGYLKMYRNQIELLDVESLEEI
ncbi:Crp/Fnr family transcriptional regulator [Enterococcus eurekensis]|uniref:Crp/Fnr family transcriptional regulator n=2 Tax=Enterococcus TaxID=1350 RepID=A0ABV9M435_9ENTE|nr:Crp/Fnr family transcriptional regulator [Candidatus Enterococcus avicola]